MKRKANSALYNILDRRNLRVADLAEKTGLSKHNLYVLAQGKHQPQLSTARRIARALACEIQDVFPGASWTLPALLSSAQKERAAEIFLRRGSGETLQQIAEEFGITKERVRQILFKIEQQHQRRSN